MALAAPQATPDRYSLSVNAVLTAEPTTLKTYASDFSGSQLPDFLTGTGFSVQDGTFQRVGPAHHDDRVYVRTKDGDLFDKDFRFELSITSEYSNLIDVYYVGFGHGDFRQGFGYHEPVDSLFFRNHGPQTANGHVAVANGPLSEFSELGSITTPGTHRLRIEKVGNSATFTMDVNYTGYFVPDITYTVANIRQASPGMQQGDTHLFFGTGVISNHFDDFVLETIRPSSVLSNDTSDSGPLTAQLVTPPAHGTLNLAADGSFVYTPNTGYSGPDTFQYVAVSNGVSSDPATVSIQVGSPPGAATAVDDAYTLDEDVTLGVGGAITNMRKVQIPSGVQDLLKDEVSGKLWFSAPDDTNPLNGYVQSIDPITGQFGPKIIVGQGPGPLAVTSNGQYLYVGVNGPRQVKRVDLSTNEVSAPYQIPGNNVAEDIESPPGRPDLVMFSLASIGTSPRQTGATLLQNMEFKWHYGELAATNIANNLDFNDAGDQIASFSTELSNHGYRVLAFDPPNLPVPGLYNEYQFSSGGEVRWEGNHLFFESGHVVDPKTLLVEANLPNGRLAFDRVGNRVFMLQDQRINIFDITTLAPLPSIPLPEGLQTVRNAARWGQKGLSFLAGDRDLYFFESDLLTENAPPRGVFLNDENLGSGMVQSVIVQNPSHGTVQFKLDGSFQYTPASHYSGEDSFTYRVLNSAGFSNDATVRLTIRGVNDPPAGVNDFYIASGSRGLRRDAVSGVLANDTDPDSTGLTASLVQAPANGTLVLNANGSFVYMPNAGFSGFDTFLYTASDGSASSTAAQVTISVRSFDVDLALRAVTTASPSDVAATLPESIVSANVGEPYFVELWVRDTTVNPQGVTGGQIDIQYQNQQSDVGALSHGSVFNLLSSGLDKPRLGLVNDFGGGTLSPSSSASPNWARLGYLQVDPIGGGRATYKFQPGEIPFSLAGRGNVDWGRVDYAETLTVTHNAEARLDLRAVLSPTQVNSAGGVAALPNSFSTIDEWTPYWVEVYVDTQTSGGAPISQVHANVEYDTRYVTAQEIVPGPAFAGGSFTGTIDDATGVVTELGGNVTGDLANQKHVLLARIKMVPTASDQAGVDEVRHFIGPYDPGLQLTSPRVDRTGIAGTARTSTPIDQYPEVWAVPYDIDDNDVIDFGDLSFFAPAFGKSVATGEPPYVWWADFTKSQASVDFADLSLLSSNFGKSKQTGAVTNAANFPEAWRNPDDNSLPPPAASAPPAAPEDKIDIRLVVVATTSASDSASRAPTGLTRVEAQKNYVLEVWVHDNSPTSLGITGGEIDIRFTKNRITAGALQTGNIYNSFSRAALNSADASVDALGGGTLQSQRGAAAGWARLGYMPFSVHTAGPIAFEATLGDLLFSRYASGNVARESMNVQQALLNIVPGDIDQDADVDIVDFIALRRNFGKGTLRTQGDLDANGKVDISDFVILRTNFGRRASALETSAAAEPSAHDYALAGAVFAQYAASGNELVKKSLSPRP